MARLIGNKKTARLTSYQTIVTPSHQKLHPWSNIWSTSFLLRIMKSIHMKSILSHVASATILGKWNNCRKNQVLITGCQSLTQFHNNIPSCKTTTILNFCDPIVYKEIVHICQQNFLRRLWNPIFWAYFYVYCFKAYLSLNGIICSSMLWTWSAFSCKHWVLNRSNNGWTFASRF